MSFGTPLASDNTSTKSFSSDEKGFKVLTKTIIDLIKDNDIDDFNIVKIDIEGAEIYLGEDLINLSKRKSLNILFSLHPCFWTNKQEALAALKEPLMLYDVYDAWESKKVTYENIVKKANETDIFELVLKTKD